MEYGKSALENMGLAGKAVVVMDIHNYNGKKVLVTGHTGFKGTWLCQMLKQLGAEVAGYALEPPTVPSLFEQIHASRDMESITGDIRDLEKLRDVFRKVKPEVVFHLAAQPIVRESYKSPVYTYETNVMGTVNVLECVRHTDSARSVVNVTTDKVYRNYEWDRGYVETDELNGYDPYSNSKSCSELVTASYINSFLRDLGVAVSTCRAGNVIGGGDYGADRIIPDCVRAAGKGEKIIVRNPNSVRPYQHVLEPLSAYLMAGLEQLEDQTAAGSYNVGPDDSGCLATGGLVSLFCDVWGEGASWETQTDHGPHEANFLRLDCTKIKERLGWSPMWDMRKTIESVVEFEKIRLCGSSAGDCAEKQIHEYIKQRFGE